MSAIAAIFNLDESPVNASALRAMSDELAHRGNCGAEILAETSVGLIQRMLHITAESRAEKLPAKSRNGFHFIACDARIDNRAELISQLGLSEREDSPITDGELILAAYEKWGAQCPARLIGDFVFVIWDRMKRRIFAARDPLGVKHFYYYREPGKLFALASEIKALLVLPGVERKVNEENLGDYLVLNFEDKESTLFKGVKRLPATHSLIVDAENLRIQSYWKPDTEKEIKLRNHAEYHAAFREKFTEAVVCRTRSDYPVGAMLSGGLDSSSIVCVASRHLAEKGKPPLHSFSAIFPTVSGIDSSIDERCYIESVVKKSGCRAHFVNCDDDNPLKDMDELMRRADHPVGMPNYYIHWEIFKRAHNAGVRVLLDGFDGDSTVSHGYEDLARLSKRGRWLRLCKEAVLLNQKMPRPAHRLKNLKRVVLRYGLDNAMPLNLAKLWYLINLRKGAEKPKNRFASIRWKIVKDEFRAKHCLEERFNHYNRLNYRAAPGSIENHWETLTGGLFAKSLELAELGAQSFSIEPRFPFYDRRLIEFCIALPPGERIYNGWTRAIFRYAMSGLLPEDVQWRDTKANLGAGIKLNVLKYGFSELEDALDTNSQVLENYLDIDKLKTVKEQFAKNPLKADVHACLILVAATCLSRWLRQNGFAQN